MPLNCVLLLGFLGFLQLGWQGILVPAVEINVQVRSPDAVPESKILSIIEIVLAMMNIMMRSALRKSCQWQGKKKSIKVKTRSPIDDVIVNQVDTVVNRYCPGENKHVKHNVQMLLKRKHEREHEVGNLLRPAV